MDIRKQEMIAEFRNVFLNYMELHSSRLDGKSAVMVLLTQLKKMIGAEEVSLFRQNIWKQKLSLSLSTNLALKSNEMTIEFYADEEKCLKAKEYVSGPIDLIGLHEYTLIVPLKQDGAITGLLAIKEGARNSFDFPFESLAVECVRLIQIVLKISSIADEERRNKQLFRVTEKFHSSMNMDDVLGEIIYTLQQVYPTFMYFLLLSHDNNQHGELPIKELRYDSGNIAAMQAYVTGTTQFEDSIIDKQSILYAPLKGKQGVYGVLQVISPDTLMFPKNEVEFITLLANTAGSAMENAQLYQQSKQLIADLQLINETSRCLNSNLRLSEIMNYMREQISKSFQAEAIGFVMDMDQEKMKIIPGSSEYFQMDDSKAYISYIKNRLEKEQEAIFLGDLRLEEAVSEKYRSIMAVPMIQSGKMTGFALVMHRSPYYFSFEMFKLLQSLIHHSTLAFTNSILHEELERMVVTDHLTKLFSRSYLDVQLTESMKENQQGTFILIDIDNFKYVNDTYGHQVGDEILVQVANVVKQSIRSSDIGARWGGEELSVYLPGVGLEIGKVIAERIRSKVESETNPGVTISCGISHWSTKVGDSVGALFKRADTALYQAKNTGKNRVLVG
ncbi:MAG: diguanylate cyclase domain-containing protein [Bacillus sp. (in: firmicutes)]